MDSTPEKVSIIVRVRPNLKHESPRDFVNILNKNSLELLRPANNIRMRFSEILGKENTQEEVFSLTKESVDLLLVGINSTIFAYGQTGAGKTYTIIGEEGEKSVPTGEERGILVRTLESVTSELESKKSTFSFKLHLSFFEVYNEKIYDLLKRGHFRSSSSLGIRENCKEVQIPDLTVVELKSLNEGIAMLGLGLRNRATGSTISNPRSSRSHSIFQLTLCKQTANSQIVSTLRIVDLAGSEKFSFNGQSTNELRIQELTSINGSLSSLGNVIAALADKTRQHIPFRNSKLTRVLSDSLNGNSRIFFIICVSPSITAAEETLSTLQFANRAKRVILDGRGTQANDMSEKKNHQFNQEELKILKQAYQKERSLREEYEKIITETKSVSFKNEFSALRTENEELKQKIKNLQNPSQLKSGLPPEHHYFLHEKNLVFQKIKQKIQEYSDNNIDFEDEDLGEETPIASQTVFQKKSPEFQQSDVRNQRNLSVSPSKNYLLRAETSELRESSNKTPEGSKSRIECEKSELEKQAERALEQLKILQEKDSLIKMNRKAWM